ncbi:uncharacterized protein DUF4115 [Kribbella amoyensis]|uniref:Uncharacterized protein DUF4115 n=1 Tax=Kribbella amoyensis TaxID=996641 RepID=A0A561BXL6_9ACTN|nr:helix-turn-helix domain-containing protein [Kribbella amoyensis]TWD83593.1 uncharacterized protein DUF4115 [Kribbella amoyensis]
MSIGSELTAARERAGMTVEQLSAATRIRSGLIVAMEADDFTRCGGNFYARGHIRSIARAVQADPAALLAAFDESHPQADPELNRQEERAELKKKPALHPARPRWAVVLGAILVGLMGWGMVRLFTVPNDVEANASKTTPTVAVTTPTAKPSAPKPPAKPTVKPTPKSPKVVITLKAARDGSYVTLRNYYGERLFQGLLGRGSTQTVTYPGSIRVTVGNIGNLAVFVNGQRVYPKTERFMITPTGAIAKAD